MAKKPETQPAAKPAPKKTPSASDKLTKAQIITSIAESTSLTKKQVTDVFAALGGLVVKHMKRRGSGEFSIPDTGVKIRRVKKPARKSRMGRNPATGEAMKIAAKPATTTVKLVALKALKDVVNT